MRVFDAVVPVQVEGRIHEVGRKRGVLLACKNLLETGVVIDVDVLVFVFLDDGVEVITAILGFLEFVDELREFFSCHFFFRTEERRRSRTGEMPPSIL